MNAGREVKKYGGEGALEMPARTAKVDLGKNSDLAHVYGEGHQDGLESSFDGGGRERSLWLTFCRAQEGWRGYQTDSAQPIIWRNEYTGFSMPRLTLGLLVAGRRLGALQ